MPVPVARPSSPPLLRELRQHGEAHTNTGRFSAENFKPVLDAAGKIPAGPITFRGQDFATREEALASALGDLDTWAQINLLNKEDYEHGRTLSRSEVARRLGSVAAGLRRVLQSLTDKDGKLLPQLRNALIDAAEPREDAARALPPTAHMEAIATRLLKLDGDAADAPELARLLEADKHASRRVDGAFAELLWLLQRSERAKAGDLMPMPDHKLIGDIRQIWTEILGRKAGKVGGKNGPFVRFAETALVLVGQPRTPNAIRQAARRLEKLIAEML